MAEHKDGGSAFPQHDLSGYGMGPSCIDGGDRFDVSGMTLRDYFAARSIIAQGDNGLTFPTVMACRAYAIADAMLAARSSLSEQDRVGGGRG